MAGGIFIKRFLETGQIVSLHGVRGEVKVHPWSDTPDFLCSFKRFYLDPEGITVLEAERVRAANNMVILKLAGINTPEDARKLIRKTLFIDRNDTSLKKGEYFVQDIIGLEVKDADTGENYGSITEVSQTGANDVYHILRPSGKTDLIPAIKDVVIKTDVENGLMLIRPLKGLFEDED